MEILQAHSDGVFSVTFSRTPKSWPRAVADSFSHSPQCSEALGRGRAAEVATLPADTGTIYSVVFSPDGKRSLGAARTSIKLWDVASQPRRRVRFWGHTAGILVVAFSRMAGCWRQRAAMIKQRRLWDVATGQTKHILTGHTGWFVVSRSCSTARRE
jgi:WD40 repeat protein